MSALGVSDIGLGVRSRPSHRVGLSFLFAGGALGVWYDPFELGSMFQDDAGTTAAAIDAPVGRVEDKSGNGHHAVQALPASRPILREDAQGRRFLEFDGVDDALCASFAIAQPTERISAVRQLGWVSFGRVFAGVSAAAPMLYQGGASPQLVVQSGTVGPGAAGAAIGADAVVTERHHGAASRLAINGGAYATADAGALPGDGIVLGNRGARDRPSKIRLYGVAMRAGLLSDEEIARTQAFMAARADIQI